MWGKSDWQWPNLDECDGLSETIGLSNTSEHGMRMARSISLNIPISSSYVHKVDISVITKIQDFLSLYTTISLSSYTT